MIKSAVILPATVGLIASSLSLGMPMGGASASPGPVAIPAVATEVADERGGHLIPVNDRRHHRHKHRHRHNHQQQFHSHNERVVIVEPRHYVPVYRERVEHYHYVERPNPYFFNPLFGGVFLFSFD